MIRYVLRRPSSKWVVACLGMLAAFQIVGNLNASQQGRTKVKVSNATRAAAILESGGKLLEDYGAFQVIEVSDEELTKLAGTVEPLLQNSLIKLNTGVIDTSTAEAQRQSREGVAASSSGRSLRLVQFSGPVKPEWLSQLKDLGASIVSYVPHNAYLIYAPAASVVSVQKMAADSSGPIQWQGEFQAAYKIQPSALSRSGSDGKFVVQMVDDTAANQVTEGLVGQLKLGGLTSHKPLGGVRNLIVALKKSDLPVLASRPDVISIAPYESPELMDERQALLVSGNVVEQGDLNSGFRLLPMKTNYLAWLEAVGITPEKLGRVIVDVTDSGIDDGTTNGNHIGLHVGGILTNPSKVVYHKLFGTRTNDGNDSLAGCGGHGTIDAHIIAGYAGPVVLTVETNITVGDATIVTNFFVTNFVGLVDEEGYSYGLGVAPFARLGSSVILAPEDTEADPVDVLDHASEQGAKISANSWGFPNDTSYNAFSQAYDYLVRDSRERLGYQSMAVVFAAGNFGPFSGSVTAPGNAKNVITVGASENVHPFLETPEGIDGSGAGNEDADNGYEIADFSSRGPTRDGRHKPDIMAPGTHISGGAPQAPAEGDPLVNTVLECFAENPERDLTVSGGAVSRYHPAGQTLYTASSGTSQATPAVAGAAALLHAYWDPAIAGAGSFIFASPSPAMVKAYLMNSARYMKEAGGDLWSDSQGMGLLDLGRGFDGLPRLLVDQDRQQLFTSAGQIRRYVGVISDSNQPVRVTLAWTDPAGSTVGPASVNDLDLEVFVNGERYLGNLFSGEYSVAQIDGEGNFDRNNNVESVFLPAGIEGTIAIFIRSAELNGSALFNDDEYVVSQDFALAGYNVEVAEVATVIKGAQAFIREQNGVDNGFVDPGETVSVSLALKNIGTLTAEDVRATLVASDSITPVTVEQVSYGDLEVDADEVAREFTFVVSTNVSCGSEIPVVLNLEYNGQPQGSVQFTLEVGFTISEGGVIGRSGQKIVIRDNRAAVPFPSIVSIGQINADSDGVVVELNGFQHPNASDVVAIVVNPAGEGLVLIANNFFNVTSSSMLVFDDSAPNTASGTVQLEARFRPRGGDLRLVSLPSGVLDEALPETWVNSFSELSLGGMDGEWKLIIFDNVGSSAGSVDQGWTIRAEGGRSFCNVRLADISVSHSVTPERAQLNDIVTYTINVTNLGPNSTTNVVLVHSLAPTLSLTRVGTSQGTYVVDANEITFSLGQMDVGAFAKVTVAGRYTLPAEIESSSRVYLVGVDLDPVADNNEVATVTALGRVLANTNSIQFASSIAGPAVVYPSSINVSGLVGLVKSVQVTLDGVSHGYPRDLDVLLVGPQGEKVMLMSDVGAASSINDLLLAFNDDAESLPRGLFGSGGYRPTDQITNDNALPSPAPVGPYSSAMGVFAGKNPNGLWSLYVNDDRTGGSGAISRGWSLQITLGNSITNDLKLTQMMPNSMERDSQYLVSLYVTNTGPTNATVVYVTNALSDSLAVVSAEPSNGTAEIEGNRVLWTIGAMQKGAIGRMDVTVTPVALGAATSVSTVASADNELNSGNNVATNIANVTLAPGVTESPLPINIPDFGQADSYPSSIVVSNLVDPVLGVSVTLNRLSHSFPADLDVVLVSPGGKQVMLMSDAGNDPVQGISLTFNGSTENPVPQGFLRSGVFSPANYRLENDEVPGLVGPFTSDLSEFVGIDGNGTWSLYVYDRVAQYSGLIAGGWDLVLTTGLTTPSLTIRLESPKIVVSWPSAASGFQLQSAPSLGNGVTWTTVTSPMPVVVGGQNVITNSVTNAASFFRLAR